MKKTNHHCLGSWFLGDRLAGPKRQWTRGSNLGKYFDQIDEINNQHTNKRYFKDILLDERKIQSLS